MYFATIIFAAMLKNKKTPLKKGVCEEKIFLNQAGEASKKS